MKTYITIIAVAAALALVVTGCSTKETVTTGTQYKCKSCGKIYRDDTKVMKLDKSLAKDMKVTTVEGWCPKCGDEITTVDQIQHRKCPICGADVGTETKKLKIEKKLSDTLPKETEVPVACAKPMCTKAGRFHTKYNWEWNYCKAVANQGIDYGFSEDMVREAWGGPKRTEKVPNGTRWYYDAGFVTIGPSGKVVEIKQ